jgi:hypothetical protein
MITPQQFSSIKTIGGCLPETVISPGKSVIVSLVQLAYLDALSVPWICMHVTDLVGVQRNSLLATASKAVDTSPGATMTVTSNEPFFLSSDVGSMITWSNNQQSYVTGYLSSTQVQVVNSTGITNPATGAQDSYFILTPTVPNIINKSMGAAVCGIQSTSPDKFNLPGGYPESILTTSLIGVVAGSPFQPRRYTGPDKIAVSVLNNTRNFELHVAVNTAMRYTRGI